MLVSNFRYNLNWSTRLLKLCKTSAKKVTISERSFFFRDRNKKEGGSATTTSSAISKNNKPSKGSALRHSKSITLSGYNLILNANQNKGLAFTKEERSRHRLTGLLPAGVHTQEHQVMLVMEQIRAFNNPLNKYMLMRDLQDTNKQLFYRTLQLYPDELMPIVYTPVVGLACQEYSRLFKRPRGMFITAEDAGQMDKVFANWDEPDIKAIVVTDGERILGLGDLGAHGMGISVGKLALYSALGGIPPGYTLPVCIDVGTNNAALLADPFYIGLHRKRMTGPAYDALIDEFMQTVVKRYGADTLVQFEDFGNHNAHRLLVRYRNAYCSFNDDIQGTASVSLAGLFAYNRVTGHSMSDHRILFMGAGTAAEGIAHLIVAQMVAEGSNEAEAVGRISMFDIEGLITSDRCPKATGAKIKYGKEGPPTKKLEEAVKRLRPTTLIGVSAVGGAFTPSILQLMAQTNLHPLILALSNPTGKSECTAEEAYSHTNGRGLFASGSPFSKVSFGGRVFESSQCNNAYIFPAVALAVMACGVRRISDEVFIVAARALADEVNQAELDAGRLYPRLRKIRPVTLAIGTKLAEWFYAQGLATVYPEPASKYDFLKGLQYEPLYDPLPKEYK